MTPTPTIFAALSGSDQRQLVSEAIPSIRQLLSRRALPKAKAEALYRHLWLGESARWNEDEQRDFALGYFMANMDSDDVLLMPPNCGAFTQNRGDTLPTARRQYAYRCGVAFAQGAGSDEAFRIKRGAAFVFGMNPYTTPSASAQIAAEDGTTWGKVTRFAGSVLTDQ